MLEAFLTSNELTFAMDLLLSLVFGYLIGSEREARGKAAGISTQCLVIAGSMAFCFLSLQFDPGSPSRIAANVVTGIGFLGAGLIFFNQSKNQVVNLTTAATIWISAAIGMCIGFNQHILALLLAAFTIVTLRMPHIILPHWRRRA